jgi:hypothetical protein
MVLRLVPSPEADDGDPRATDRRQRDADGSGIAPKRRSTVLEAVPSLARREAGAPDDDRADGPLMTLASSRGETMDRAAGSQPPARDEVARARRRVDSMITWTPGLLPRNVVTFLAEAALDRSVLADELDAIERQLAEARAELHRAGRPPASMERSFLTAGRAHLARFGVGVVSGVILTLGSLFGPNLFAP